MPVAGTIVYGAWNGSNPIGSVTLIGEDGNNYIVANTDFTIFVHKPWRLGQVQDENILDEYDVDAWNTEFAVRQPDAGGPFILSRMLIPVQGTKYFFLSAVYNPEPDEQQWGLLLMKINASGQIEPCGSILMQTGVNEGPTPGGVCFGCGILESTPGFVYVIVEGGYVDVGTASTWVIRLPVSETDITDLSSEAITNFGVRLSTHGASHPLSWSSFYGGGGERVDAMGNKAVIVEGNTKDLAVLRYRGLGATPGIFIADIDLDDFLGVHGNFGAPAFTGSYISDISSSFDGFPWADIGNHLDLSASTDDHDDYTVPSILPGGQWVFLRSDSADPTQVFGRVYERNGETITAITTFQFTHNAANIVTFVNAVEAWRPPGSDIIIVGIRDDFRWIIGEFDGLELPDFEGAIGGSGAQMEPVGIAEELLSFALTAGRGLEAMNSCIELGPFRFAEQKQADETALISSLVLGISQEAIGIVIFEDYMEIDSNTDDEDYNEEVDQDGDDIYEDWSEGSGDSDDFHLTLRSTDDGISAQFQGDEELEWIEDFGSSKQYVPVGYSAIFHRLHICAHEVDEYWAVKTIDIAGVLTGRHL